MRTRLRHARARTPPSPCRTRPSAITAPASSSPTCASTSTTAIRSSCTCSSSSTPAHRTRRPTCSSRRRAGTWRSPRSQKSHAPPPQAPQAAGLTPTDVTRRAARRALPAAAFVAAAIAVVADSQNARDAAGQSWRALVLVTGLLLVGVVATDDGRFAWLAGKLDAIPGGGRRLFFASLALVAATTAVLHL